MIVIIEQQTIIDLIFMTMFTITLITTLMTTLIRTFTIMFIKGN